MGGLGIIVLLVVVGTTIWVATDVGKRNWKPGSSGAATWVVGCILLWIIVFPMYLIQRSKTTEKGTALPGGGIATSPRTNANLYRTCPHCKEPMRRDAGTCPHCRKESPAWTLHEGRWWFRANEEKPWQLLDDATGTWQEFGPPDETAALALPARPN